MRNPNKKLLKVLGMVLLVGLMAVLLGACVIKYESTDSTSATQPAATQPAETQPAATQPTDTQPAATQPAATQPAETQPAETQPVETQPAATESAPAEIVELKFTPIADAETRSGDTSNPGPASQNFGTNNKVTYIKGASNERLGFIMFNVEGIGNGEVKSAKLLVYYASKAGGDAVGSTQVYLTDTNWSEDNITHNNQPALGEMVAEYSNTGIESGHWQSIDLTNVIKGDGLYSFAFVGVDSTIRLDIASKEFADSELHPLLIIEVSK